MDISNNSICNKVNYTGQAIFRKHEHVPFIVEKTRTVFENSNTVLVFSCLIT